MNLISLIVIALFSYFPAMACRRVKSGMPIYFIKLKWNLITLPCVSFVLRVTFGMMDTRSFIIAYNDIILERYEQRMKMVFNFDFIA